MNVMNYTSYKIQEQKEKSQLLYIMVMRNTVDNLENIGHKRIFLFLYMPRHCDLQC